MYFAARTSTTWHSIEFEAWWFDVRVHRCVGLDYCDVVRIKRTKYLNGFKCNSNVYTHSIVYYFRKTIRILL